MKILEKLGPEFEALPKTDDRKLRYTKLRIEALDCACAYNDVQAEIADALSWIPVSERPALKTKSTELALLQGEFAETEE